MAHIFKLVADSPDALVSPEKVSVTIASPRSIEHAGRTFFLRKGEPDMSRGATVTLWQEEDGFYRCQEQI